MPQVNKRKFAEEPVSAKKGCTISQFSMVSLQICDRYAFSDDDNSLIEVPEWSIGGRTQAACIQMGTPLRVIVTLVHEAETLRPDSDLTLSCRLQIDNGISLKLDSNPTPILASENCIQFIIDTHTPVSPYINKSTVKFNQFTMTQISTMPIIVSSRVIKLSVYTVFNIALNDNVRESTLVDPGATISTNQVERYTPFFTEKHVAQACKWARGASQLGTGNEQTDIVLKTVRSIPNILYGEADDYFDNHDGWNVWDAPKRSADCSQLASFFADVLGVLGVRAHDFELKCEYIYEGQLYRRYFGNPDPDNWPTHGVLLVRYPNNIFQCYDTTFSPSARTRITCSLAQALTVGVEATFMQPGWEHWYLIDDGDVLDLPEGVTDTLLTENYPETSWRADMIHNQAPARFPEAEVQQNQ